MPETRAAPFGGYGSPCGDLALQRRRAAAHAGNPGNLPAVWAAFPDLADCAECDMCGGCETHEGCLTDLGHLDWFMQFASPGETPCGREHTRDGTPYICAKPAGHGGEWHMARTGDGWPNTAALPALDQPGDGNG
jgi:hypothetical protein